MSVRTDPSQESEIEEIAADEIGDLTASSRDYVNALARGLEVITVFTRFTPKMTLSEIAQATGMTRATARRFLLTLVHEGYVDISGKHFSLTPKVLQLGFSALSSMDLWDVAQPVMNDLSEKLSESCFSAVLDDQSVIYVARATPNNRRVNVGISIGSRVPAYCVSTGRVLLAALPEEDVHRYIEDMVFTKFTPNTITSKVQLRSLLDEVRRQGWSIVDQELEVGLRSLSVPIRDGAGQIVAALNVCCPSTRISLDDMKTRILAMTLEASRNITRALHR
ncbi:IclR family transcriptional regulator C-terminal domain-containing protein [Shinella sp.]|uniref:IclR family transcriptional regulator domain-containing protein n=1 Tax=Shinella sp. TaxID=1870904 RepID=UPI0029ACDD5D|nr:IclR family transcriptional regulator C-terminal domain-containing protein [Shinella sp.]MDX3975462.1 IclR family transcriptional regulator C-terminal domain-containing protein [Shinella sp.]